MCECNTFKIHSIEYCICICVFNLMPKYSFMSCNFIFINKHLADSFSLAVSFQFCFCLPFSLLLCLSLLFSSVVFFFSSFLSSVVEFLYETSVHTVTCFKLTHWNVIWRTLESANRLAAVCSLWPLKYKRSHTHTPSRYSRSRQ